MAIDYGRMKRVYPKQKSALTRAQKKGYDAVLNVCKAVIREWDEIGAWPDGWHSWQNALDDAAYKARQQPPRLESLRFD
jgi:hypothetical protein